MIKSKKQMFIVIGIFAFIMIIAGTTYAWFNYKREGVEQRLIAGNIYLNFNENNDGISLTNVFPETPEEARSRNDNFITFEISGINESNKTMFYEIDINHGTEKESPYARFLDKDLRFDLVELDSNGDEVKYLLNAVSYDELINKKIWVDTIESASSTEVSRKYKLRMWLSEDVLISDSDPNANYLATGYKNHYANIKLTVIGDFNEKYFGYQKVQKAIQNKESQGGTCSNITYEEDGITYFSGTNECIDMNYVWYSGKLWRITAIYPDGAMKLVTHNNITSIAFNVLGGDAFYTDANTTSYIYQWLNEDFYDTLYNASDFIDTEKLWNATMPVDTIISTKLGNDNIISANVGLLNSYEYYNSYRCIGSADCNGSSYGTGYLNIDYYWWLLNPYSASRIWCVVDFAYGYNYSPTFISGSRPSIYLKSSLEFTGSGTSSEPYKIVGDKGVGIGNELVNTRLSGEYVKLKNGDNEQLFRIIGIEDNKTKIIAMDYAENKNTRTFATSTGSANTLWGSGATTDTDTWYEYLNRVDTEDISNTGYYDNLEKTYGYLFDVGVYQLGTSDYNYKNSICPDPVPKEGNVCAKEFKIGLPRYGEMFATQQSGGSYNSINMWFMNRYSSMRVWSVRNYGANGSDTDYSTNTYGARPTLHLKSTVKIISGTGTETDPYVVGL